LPSVVKLHEEFKDKGLQVLGANGEGKAPRRIACTACDRFLPRS
jgi:hypothetical protein